MSNNTVDFDLQGIVGIRLLHAEPRNVAMLRRQLGTTESSLDRPPDLIIRYVDELPRTSRLRYLDLHGAAFDEHDFYLLPDPQRPARVQLPFQQLGQPCEIVCERGVSAVPRLIDIVSVIALANGYLPLRGAAFNFQGVGALVTGWAKSGKLDLLLGLMQQGAQYVAHEWAYVCPAGQQLLGVPRAMRLWKWQLDGLPDGYGKLNRALRRRLKVLGKLHRLTASLAAGRACRRAGISKLMSRALPLIRKQLHVDLQPEEFFGRSALTCRSTFDKLFFTVSHASSCVSVERIAGQEVAQRLGFALQAERDDFLAAYQQYRFAFPHRPNEWIDRLHELQQERMLAAFGNKEAFLVSHPHPVVIQDLVSAILPHLTESSPRPIAAGESKNEINEKRVVALG